MNKKSSETPAPTRRFWIGVASRDHVQAGVDGGFCQLCHGKAGPMRRLKPGDGIVYYSPRSEMRGGETVQAFTAIGTVKDGEAYPFDMGGGFVPTRRDIAFGKAHDAPIKPLLDRLSFTKGRKSWGAAFRFGVLEITEADFALIAGAMGAQPAKTP
jgi:hypothetical protein